MVDWVNIGDTIAYDWYEIRCHVEKDNRLKVYLNGLKDIKQRICIDFGKVILYKAIDEGWNLNPFEYEDSSGLPPTTRDAILIELSDSRLSQSVQEKCSCSPHHYQVLGINFGIDVITEGIPVILTV